LWSKGIGSSGNSNSKVSIIYFILSIFFINIL
jgi:hypothetical protein